MTIMKSRSPNFETAEYSWSLVDPKPVLRYVRNVDEYIVYWNGLVMPHHVALCLAMEQVGIFPTPEMKAKIRENYKKIYYAGGFGTRQWDTIAENFEIYSYFKDHMTAHIRKVTEGRAPSEILGWFDYKRARQ